MKTNTKSALNMIGLFVSFIQMNEQNQEEIINGKVIDTKGTSVTIDCREYDYELTEVVVDLSDITFLDEEPNKVIRRFKEVPTFVIEKNEETNEEVSTVVKEKKVSNKSNDKGPSEKLQKCIDIVNNNSQLKRKDLIKLIIDNVGMTPAGASTYLYNSQQYIKNNN